jgi:hypothetical protein
MVSLNILIEDILPLVDRIHNKNTKDDPLFQVNTDEFVLQMRNANTVRTTNSDVNKFKDWSKEQNEDRDSHEILSAELDLYV